MLDTYVNFVSFVYVAVIYELVVISQCTCIHTHSYLSYLQLFIYGTHNNVWQVTYTQFM